MFGNDFLVTTNNNIQDVTPGYLFCKALFPTMPKEYEKDFDVVKVDTHTKLSFGKKMMRAAQRTGEGGQSAYGSFGNYGQKVFSFPIYSLQVNISRTYLMDNLYRETAPQLGTAFLQSTVEAINLEVAEFYRNGFSENNVGLDGLPLYSLEHPTDSGDVANTLDGYYMFNLSSLTQSMINMWRFKARNGFFIGKTRAKVLTLPPEYVPQAFILLESTFRPGTSSFELNPARGMKYISDGIHENSYIPKNMVFIRTTIPGFYFFLREPFDIAQMPNISTWSLLTSSFIRFEVDFDQWQASLAIRAPLDAKNYV